MLLNRTAQSSLSVPARVCARPGTLARTWATQRLNRGGSVGTIAGAPGPLVLFALTNIQWLNTCRGIGFPATTATSAGNAPSAAAGSARARTATASASLRASRAGPRPDR